MLSFTLIVGSKDKCCTLAQLLLICALSMLFSLVQPEPALANSTDSSIITATHAVEAVIDGELSASQTLEPPIFSHVGGFYTDAFQLTLSTQETDTSIYYTIDGSEPTIAVARYEAPISVASRVGDSNVHSLIRTTLPEFIWREPTEEIFKATTIRARVIRADGEVSPIVTHTYFVDPAGADRYSLPVISIVSDAANFFDPETGIYVPGEDAQDNSGNPNYAETGREWERPVHLELFAEDGTRILAQNAGVRTHGGFTRAFQSKSLRFYARSEYGASTFDAQLFPDRPFTNYETFILRNAGNDWNFAHFRDGLIHRTVEHLPVDIQAFRPVIVFLNGEYWGLLNMRERQDKEYLQTHYGIPTDAVDMLELPDEVSEGSDTHYNAMVAYVETNGASTPESYAYIQTQMDLDNFIDYNIIEIFSGNLDWPHNNVENWRYQADTFAADAPYGFDGRWRWFVKDLDFGFGYWIGGDYAYNMLNRATSPTGSGEGAWSTLLLRSLLENETFRHNFINRFADLLNTTFLPERVKAIADEITASLAPELPEHIRRYQQPQSMASWQHEVQVVQEFIQARPQYQRQHIVDFFNLGGIATVEFNVSNVDAGYIRINSLMLDSETVGATSFAYPWQGIYFQDVPVNITAIPRPGYNFVGWEGLSDAQLANEATVELVLSDELNLTARFEASPHTMTFYLPHVHR